MGLAYTCSERESLNTVIQNIPPLLDTTLQPLVVTPEKLQAQLALLLLTNTAK